MVLFKYSVFLLGFLSTHFISSCMRGMEMVGCHCGFVYFSLQFCFCFVYSAVLLLMHKHLALVCLLVGLTTLSFGNDYDFCFFFILRLKFVLC
jgi:hypothetical protein